MVVLQSVYSPLRLDAKPLKGLLCEVQSLLAALRTNRRWAHMSSVLVDTSEIRHLRSAKQTIQASDMELLRMIVGLHATLEAAIYKTTQATEAADDDDKDIKDDNSNGDFREDMRSNCSYVLTAREILLPILGIIRRESTDGLATRASLRCYRSILKQMPLPPLESELRSAYNLISSSPSALTTPENKDHESEDIGRAKLEAQKVCFSKYLRVYVYIFLHRSRDRMSFIFSFLFFFCPKLIARWKEGRSLASLSADALVRCKFQTAFFSERDELVVNEMISAISELATSDFHSTSSDEDAFVTDKYKLKTKEKRACLLDDDAMWKLATACMTIARNAQHRCSPLVQDAAAAALKRIVSGCFLRLSDVVQMETRAALSLAKRNAQNEKVTDISSEDEEDDDDGGFPGDPVLIRTSALTTKVFATLVNMLETGQVYSIPSDLIAQSRAVSARGRSRGRSRSSLLSIGGPGVLVGEGNGTGGRRQGTFLFLWFILQYLFQYF